MQMEKKKHICGLVRKLLFCKWLQHHHKRQEQTLVDRRTKSSSILAISSVFQISIYSQQPVILGLHRQALGLQNLGYSGVIFLKNKSD